MRLRRSPSTGAAIEVSLYIQGDSGGDFCAVDVVRKIVEDSFFAARIHNEHNATALGLLVRFAEAAPATVTAEICRAVQVARRVSHQGRVGIRPIGRVSSEDVQKSFCAARIQLEYGSETEVVASKQSGAVEVAGRITHQRRKGLGSVSATGKTVEDGFRAARGQLEHGSAAAGSIAADRGGSVQVPGSI